MANDYLLIAITQSVWFLTPKIHVDLCAVSQYIVRLMDMSDYFEVFCIILAGQH